jgi:hypothetical protein
MAKKVNLQSLNKVVPCLTANKSTKRRHVSDHSRNDAVADALSKCNNAAEVGALGMKFGLTENEVRARARSAKNFGLYRMVIGNRIRGITNRIRKAKKKNQKLTLAEAAYPPKKSGATKKTKKAKKKAKKKKR